MTLENGLELMRREVAKTEMWLEVYNDCLNLIKAKQKCISDYQKKIGEFEKCENPDISERTRLRYYKESVEKSELEINALEDICADIRKRSCWH